jgi:hypothetical protein
MADAEFRLLTDATGQELVEAMRQQNALLQVISESSTTEALTNPDSLHRLIQSGNANKVLSVGDQIAVDHSEFGTQYYDILDFNHDKDATGLYPYSITVQLHGLLPSNLLFDSSEKEVATESTFSADLSYYISSGDTYKYLTPGTDYTVGASIPTSTTYYHNAIKDTSGYIVSYGYDNWGQSSIRQYLNSEASAEKWWTAQHVGDVMPTYASRAGFLAGLDANFKRIIGTTNKITALNKVTDGAGYVQSTEKIFLLSPTEVMGGAENSIYEGAPYEYYKRLVGDTVVTGSCKSRIKYNGTTLYWWWLRSPYAGNSFGVRYISDTGSIGSSRAYYSAGIAPAFILV